MTRTRRAATMLAIASIIGLAHGEPAQPVCEDNLCCAEWAVEVRDAGGKRWGLVSGASPAEVRERLKKAQDFDRAYCRFFGKSSPCSRYEHDNPGPLRCAGAQPAQQRDAVDICAAEFARRIDALEKKFAAQERRFKTTHKLVETMRASAAAIFPRVKTTPNFATFGSYGAAFGDAMSRASRIREATAAECWQATQRMITDGGVEGASMFGGRGRYGTERDPVAELYGRGWTSGQFGGHEARASDRARLAGSLSTLEDSLSPLSLPADVPFASVSLPSKVTSVATPNRRHGEGRLIIGDLGAVDEETRIDGEELALAFAFERDGELRFGKVSVTRTKTSSGERIEVRGEGGGQFEIVTIIVSADADEDGVPDVHDKCRAVPGDAANEGCPVATVQTSSPQPAAGQPATAPPAAPPLQSLGDCDDWARAHGLDAGFKSYCGSAGAAVVCKVFEPGAKRWGNNTPQERDAFARASARLGQVPGHLHCALTPWHTPQGYRDDLSTYWACCVAPSP